MLRGLSQRFRNLSSKEKLTLILCGVVLIALAVIMIVWFRSDSEQEEPAAPVETFAPQVIEVEREKVVEVEKVISAEIIEDGLRDMGVLLTGEYYFTEVVSNSKVTQLWGVELGFTESSYLGSYDGVVTAGVDLTALKVTKDDKAHTVTVTRPKASVQNIDIDPESFVLYDEKGSIFNPLSVEDFNDSLKELEKTALSKAAERGLLDTADQNADSLIRQFVGGLVDLKEYKLTIVTE